MRKVFLAALLVAACGPIRPPGQPPTPTPTPPSPQCIEGQAHSCWHHPPESRTWLYACPVYDAAGNLAAIVNVVGGPPQCPAKPVEQPPTCAETCPAGTHCQGTVCVADTQPPSSGNIPQPPFSVRFPKADARIYSNTKDYSQGFDHTTLIEGDDELCRLLHGPQGHSPCHTDSGFFAGGQKEREGYDAWVLAGARDNRPLPNQPMCPVWQFRVGEVIRACHDDHNSAASCDHFGNTTYRDDPQTPTLVNAAGTITGFEGEPKFCAYQLDGFGPYAGFFTIAHGNAEVRSCPPLDSATTSTNCGPWKRFDH